jgi:hypothetical protein
LYVASSQFFSHWPTAHAVVTHTVLLNKIYEFDSPFYVFLRWIFKGFEKEDCGWGPPARKGLVTRPFFLFLERARAGSPSSIYLEGVFCSGHCTAGPTSSTKRDIIFLGVARKRRAGRGQRRGAGVGPRARGPPRGDLTRNSPAPAGRTGGGPGPAAALTRRRRRRSARRGETAMAGPAGVMLMLKFF